MGVKVTRDELCVGEAVFEVRPEGCRDARRRGRGKQKHLEILIFCRLQISCWAIKLPRKPGC